VYSFLEKEEPQHNAIAVLQTCEDVINAINEKGQTKFDQMIAISRYYLAHIYQLNLGVYNLCKVGLGNAAIVLVRSQLEALIDFSYLYLCKIISGDDKERYGWLAYHFVNRDSIHRKWTLFNDHRINKNLAPLDNIFREATLTTVNESVDYFKKTFFKHGNKYHWSRIPTIDKRARALDDTGFLKQEFPNFSYEEEYIVSYKYSSEFAHGESSALLAYLNDAVEHLEFIIGPNDVNVQVSLGMSSRYMLALLYLINKLNHTHIDIPDELTKNGFKIYWTKQ
jgi:hypothetical protein